MQKVTLICVGKLKDSFFKDASREYLKRLQPYCKLDIIEIPQQNISDNPNESEIKTALDKEGEQIIKKIPPRSTITAMCIEGQMYSSEELADCMSKAAMAGDGSITFIIGGSCGLSESVKSKANIKMSVSKMTFPHRLFRIMLLEQIYRACKINAGEKYHK